VLTDSATTTYQSAIMAVCRKGTMPINAGDQTTQTQNENRNRK